MSDSQQPSSAGSRDAPPRAAPRLYSVPRRYDLATLFTVTLAYALLFGAMQRSGMPPNVAFDVAGFITLVGIGQALLFKGNAPRLASVVTGVPPHLRVVSKLAQKIFEDWHGMSVCIADFGADMIASTPRSDGRILDLSIPGIPMFVQI